MAFVYRCVTCKHKIPMEEGRMPSRCPACGEGTDMPEDDAVACPAFLSAKTKATDSIYRGMEVGSERRAEAAAQMLGVPTSDMSAMKITNLNDRRDAEMAAMPVNNDVTRHMAAMNARGGNFGFQGSVDTGAATGAITVNGNVIQGIAPQAGRRAHEAIQSHHFSGAYDVPHAAPSRPLRPGER